ncbi:hypothetical protein HOK00_02580 [bacterium]|jgi:hypothetical protein|nr:hypothetical protein [bacterium]
MEKETFHITVEYIDNNNHKEGYCVCCHSSIDGIIADNYGTIKDILVTHLVNKIRNIQRIVDYTLNEKNH